MNIIQNNLSIMLVKIHNMVSCHKVVHQLVQLTMNKQIFFLNADKLVANNCSTEESDLIPEAFLTVYWVSHIGRQSVQPGKAEYCVVKALMILKQLDKHQRLLV